MPSLLAKVEGAHRDRAPVSFRVGRVRANSRTSDLPNLRVGIETRKGREAPGAEPSDMGLGIVPPSLQLVGGSARVRGVPR